MTVSIPAPLVLETELEPLASTQLGIGDNELISTTQLRKCISTTVRDVRRGYFVDGRDPTKRHEASVVVLGFEFGSQRRDTWRASRSMSHVTIRVSVDEVEEEGLEPGYDDDDDDDDGKADADVIIAAHYPLPTTPVSSWRRYLRIPNQGRVGLSRDYTFLIRRRQHVSVWELSEDKVLKAGVPGAFSCADPSY
ncbi:hypothetical protein BJX70DRAFT_360953 [Aspergillus crustosus]